MILLIFSFSTFATWSIENNTWSIENNTWSIFDINTQLTSTWKSDMNIKEWLEELNKKKNELINDLAWKDDIFKKIENLENEKKKAELSIDMLEKMNSEYQLQLEKIKLELKNIYNDKKTLLNKISEYKDAISLNNQELTRLKGEKINNAMILENLSKMKLSLIDKENEIFFWKLKNIWIIFWILIFIFIVTEIIYNTTQKELDYLNNYSKKIARLNIINVITILLLIILFIFSALYLKPELAVWFLFFWSALILIFKDIILSFFASIIILLNYDIGDEIWIEELWINIKWNLVKLTPLYMVMKELWSWNLWFSWRIIKIPNKAVFEKLLIKETSNYSKYLRDSIKIILSTSSSFEKTENRVNLKKQMDKIKEIEILLEERLIKIPLQELGIFSDFKDLKYKKHFYTDNSGCSYVDISWISNKEESNIIKEKILNILFNE